MVHLTAEVALLLFYTHNYSLLVAAQGKLDPILSMHDETR